MYRYEHVVVEHLLAVIAVLQYRKHRQHSSAISPQKAAKQVLADQSATPQADSWRGPTNVEHSHSMLSSQNERRDRNLPPPTKICITNSAAGVMREGFASSFDLNNIQQLWSFSPSFFHVFRTRYMNAASGLLLWSMEHGALGICKSPV